MTLKILRQILKALGDDTRLRIVNLLIKEELTVTDICLALRRNQPSVSKHLERLRMVKIVNDRRDGNFIYYSLIQDPEIEKILRFLMAEFTEVNAFRKDNEKLAALRN